MRVLFISVSPIQKEISIGNTFLNLFSGIEDVEFASICARAGRPDPMISRCFCITEKMLVKNLMGKGTAGGEIDLSAVRSVEATPAPDINAARFAKTKRWSIFFWAQNFLWSVTRWKSPQLREFIEDYNPDILFTVLSEKIYLNRLIMHISKLSGKKMIVYAWDNNYSLKRLSFSPFDWIGHFFSRRHMRKVAKKADKLYVISTVQKADYDKAFKKQSTVVTKAEDFSREPVLKESYSEPLQLVYTGNLYANRWKSLALLVKVLENINKDSVKAQLRIYSSTLLTDKMKKALEVENTSFCMGSVSSAEVMRIQNEADILVHAEALDLKNRLTVRQSFSTKLVDYFKVVRPILAIGPKDIASIKHLADNDAAIVADNARELYEKLSQLINDKKLLSRYAVQAYMCGRDNHDKQRQLNILKQDLDEMV